MIVADTNLLIYLYVPSTRTSQAEIVLERDPLWIAPLLWRSEFRNTLMGLIRQGTLSLDTTLQIARQAEVWMLGREYSVVTDHVLRLASQSGCSAYDCEFAALAEDQELRLVT
ncbi:MAG: type II toxin-antitoxin system VapC family toxin, partial [Gammaproteobacteria bacterium]